MGTRLYQVDFDFEIEPIWKDLPPRVRICLNDHIFCDGLIPETRSFKISDRLSLGAYHLIIELYDKSDLDGHQGIKIKNFSIGNISSSKFAWQGRYRPRYPEPWATEQREKGAILQSEISNTDYLGWNGVWQLDFNVPVFTWIHQVENLGWIYD